MEEEKILDNTIPAGNNSDSGKGEAAKNDAGNNEPPKPALKDMAAGVCIVLYSYIAELKANGHNALGNLIFQETMKMTTAASIASESIGRERFFENLEDGFYSSGRLLVYLDFAQTLKVHDDLRLAIIETVTGVHKIFAASVKTVKSKQPKTVSSPVTV